QEGHWSDLRGACTADQKDRLWIIGFDRFACGSQRSHIRAISEDAVLDLERLVPRHGHVRERQWRAQLRPKSTRAVGDRAMLAKPLPLGNVEVEMSAHGSSRCCCPRPAISTTRIPSRRASSPTPRAGPCRIGYGQDPPDAATTTRIVDSAARLRSATISIVVRGYE